MPDGNQYCTESCTEFFTQKTLHLYHIHFIHLKKFSTSTVNTECLTILSFNHQSTIHSMNTFPVNLTSANHARFVILIYSTLNSVHRVKSTSSPTTQKKMTAIWIHFAVIQVLVHKGSFYFNGSSLKALREICDRQLLSVGIFSTFFSLLLKCQPQQLLGMLKPQNHHPPKRAKLKIPTK